MINRLPDVIRYLTTQDLSARDIARSLGVSKTTVCRYRDLVSRQGKAWSDFEQLSGSELVALFNRPRRVSGKVQPEFSVFESRLSEPGMTVFRLWQEYRDQAGAGGMSYSQCARTFQRYRGSRAVSLRQTHEPGQTVFVDYSGKRPHYIDKPTGEKVPVELFVAVLGASNYLYVTCSASQTVPDWLDASTKMLEFFGGAPKVVVPDNLRSAITKAGAEPVVQREYLEWARHYGIAVLPARPGHPRDKGIVESSVRFIQQQMLPELAKHRYFSLAQINEAVQGMLLKVNGRPFQKRTGSRRSEFERIEHAALQPLPATRYEYRQWVAKQRVPHDYHVSVYGHFYSVPHNLVGKQVEACVTTTHVEMHHDGKRVARHLRRTEKGKHTTSSEHQPDAHKAMGDRTPERLMHWADTIGPNMTKVMAKQFEQKVPLQGMPAALALRNLELAVTAAELEEAAGQSLALRMPNPTGLRRLLSIGLPSITVPAKPTKRPIPLLAKRPGVRMPPPPRNRPPITGLRT